MIAPPQRKTNPPHPPTPSLASVPCPWQKHRGGEQLPRVEDPPPPREGGARQGWVQTVFVYPHSSSSLLALAFLSRNTPTNTSLPPPTHTPSGKQNETRRTPTPKKIIPLPSPPPPVRSYLPCARSLVSLCVSHPLTLSRVYARLVTHRLSEAFHHTGEVVTKKKEKKKKLRTWAAGQAKRTR